ncbi:MAG: tetratricopeptide repeat protein [Calditrichia bacterium]
MDGAILLSSSDFKPISSNIIAALLYDIREAELETIDRLLVESIYFDSITEGSASILKSENTKKKLLSKLQQKSLSSHINDFRTDGKPLAPDYFEERFSKVISLRNAAKIAPSFLDIFSKRIAEHTELSDAVVRLYATGIKRGDWSLNNDALITFERVLGQMNGASAHHHSAGDVVDVETKHSDEDELVELLLNSDGDEETSESPVETQEATTDVPESSSVNDLLVAEELVEQEEEGILIDAELPEGVTEVVPTLDMEEEVNEAIDDVLTRELAGELDESLIEELNLQLIEADEESAEEPDTSSDSDNADLEEMLGELSVEDDDITDEHIVEPYEDDFDEQPVEDQLNVEATVEAEETDVPAIEETVDENASVEDVIVADVENNIEALFEEDEAEFAEPDVEVSEDVASEEIPEVSDSDTAAEAAQFIENLESSVDLDDEAEEQLDSAFYVELEKEINEKLDKQLADERDHEDAESVGRFQTWERSGELEAFGLHQFVLPIRGMRKMEQALSANSVLYLTGFSGTGKSTLIAAYLNHLVTGKSLKLDEIFYYRFINGVSSYSSFRSSLVQFVAGIRSKEPEEVEGVLEATLAETSAFFVVDDLHYATDPRIFDLLNVARDQIKRQNRFRRKLVLIGREMHRSIRAEEDTFEYSGLSNAESNALIRDLWKLDLTPKVRRLVSQRLLGNPQCMILFRNWWQTENHTDTRVERYIGAMPAGEKELAGYLSSQLYDALELGNSRVNNFLKSISAFRVVESEEFLEEMYERSGGLDFQNQLEDLVERYNLLIYHNQLGRYQLSETMKSFYYHKIGSAQMYRILHNRAAKLYSNRFNQSNHVLDATEAAYHYTRTDKEEEAAQIIYSYVVSNEVGEHYVDNVLEVMQRLNFDAFDDEELRMQIFYTRAKLELQKRSFARAEEDFNACLSFDNLPEKIKAGVYYGLAQIFYATGDSKAAIEYCHNALDFYEEAQDQNGRADVFATLIDVYIRHEEQASTLEILEKAIKSFRSVGDRKREAYASEITASIFKENKDWERSLDYYQQTVSLHEELGYTDKLAAALDNIGVIHKNRGQWQDAINAHQRVLDLKESGDDWRLIAKASGRIGSILQLEEKLEDALTYYNHSQKLYKDNQEWRELARIHYHIGTVYRRQDENGVALGYYQSSLELYQRLEDLQGIAQCYGSIALIYRGQKDWEKALETYNRSLKIHQKTGDMRQTADVHEQMGDIFNLMDQHDEALDLYATAAAAKEEINDHTGMADILYRMGEIYGKRVEWERSNEFYRKALEIFEDTNNPRGMAKTYRALGRGYQKVERYTEVVGFLQKALQTYQDLSDKEGIAYSVYDIGNYYHDAGDWENALHYYSEVLPLFEEIDAVYNMAQALGNISSIEFEKKDHGNAIARQIEILLYFQTAEKSELVERVLGNLVACHQELGAETFQPILKSCLDRISEGGISWGRHLILPPDHAERIISSVFYNA